MSYLANRGHAGLWAALNVYDAQYGKRSIGEQHSALPPGAVWRVEAVLAAARDAQNLIVALQERLEREAKKR